MHHTFSNVIFSIFKMFRHSVFSFTRPFGMDPTIDVSVSSHRSNVITTQPILIIIRMCDKWQKEINFASSNSKYICQKQNNLSFHVSIAFHFSFCLSSISVYYRSFFLVLLRQKYCHIDCLTFSVKLSQLSVTVIYSWSSLKTWSWSPIIKF